MTPLTQYGRMAEKHWREHRPKMVRELERKVFYIRCFWRRRKDKGRNGHDPHPIDAAGVNGAAGADASVGNGAGEIHPATAQPKSSAAVAGRTFPESQQLPHHGSRPPGDGGPKQKFQQNIAAIETLRALDAEERQRLPRKRRCWSNTSAGGAMPLSSMTTTANGAKERRRSRQLCPRKNTNTAFDDAQRALHFADGHRRDVSGAERSDSMAGASSNRRAVSAFHRHHAGGHAAAFTVTASRLTR